MNQRALIFSSKIREAAEIISNVLGSQVASQVSSANELANTLEKNENLKVPFVGDFSSGKSSLLNAIIGRDILPTNITPETAISYELKYAPSEKIELYNKGSKIADYGIDEIKDIKVKPGDVAVVYLNNPVIKEYADKGIMLVDMPGIDSGIENHNAAINQYLGAGIYYMLFTDAEQGTFRNNSLSFLNELTHYKGVDFSAFFTKADKKDSESLSQMKSEADRMFGNKFGTGKTVGITSAVLKNFKDVTNALDSVDIEKITYNQYVDEVRATIDEMISAVRRNIQLLSGDISNAESAIKKIEDQRNEALSNLNKRNAEAQPVADSAQDILNDIKNAIINNSASLAAKILSKCSQEEISNCFVQTIRPVLINSFSREISEYQDVISSVIVQMSADIEKILKEEGFIKDIQDQLTVFIGKDMLNTMLTKALAKLAEKFAGKSALSTIVAILGKSLGPIITILLYIIPDIFGMIFGKSKSKKLQELQYTVSNQICGKILEGMRPEIEKSLQEQRDAMDAAAAEMIKAETIKIDTEIKEAIKVHQEQKASLENKIDELKAAETKLTSIANGI